MEMREIERAQQMYEDLRRQPLLGMAAAYQTLLERRVAIDSEIHILTGAWRDVLVERFTHAALGTPVIARREAVGVIPPDIGPDFAWQVHYPPGEGQNESGMWCRNLIEAERYLAGQIEGYRRAILAAVPLNQQPEEANDDDESA